MSADQVASQHASLLALLPILQQQAAHQLRLQHEQYALAQAGASKTALVERALNILAYEAGLSEGTMATLRQAVQSGMERKARHALEKKALTASPAGGGSPPAFAAHVAGASGQMTHHAGTTEGPGAGASPAHQPYLPVVLPRTLKPANSKRQQLTVEQAAQIYTLRPRKVQGRGSRCVIHCRWVRSHASHDNLSVARHDLVLW